MSAADARPHRTKTTTRLAVGGITLKAGLDSPSKRKDVMNRNEVAPSHERSGRARIRELRVSNYRSLGDDVVVTFGDLTVLVGPNGSGKSNVLDVLRFLGESLTWGLEQAVARRLGIARLRRSAATKPRAIKIAVDVGLPVGYATYEVQLNAAANATYKVERENLSVFGVLGATVVLDVSGGKVRTAPEGLVPQARADALVLPALAADPQVRPVIDILRAVRVHSIYPSELREPQQVGVSPPLDDKGSNWCAVLRAMDDQSMHGLSLAMEQVTGDITGVRVDSSGGYFTAEFRHQLDGVARWFSAGQESDGTLRMAGILTALLYRPAPPLIGIEEPELTINPGLLPLLVDHMQAASKDTQIAITTHSPDLLDLLDLDTVRAVQRVNGVSTVGRVSGEQRALVRRELLSNGGLMRSGGIRPEGSSVDMFDMFRTDVRDDL